VTRFIFIIFSVLLICTPAFGHPVNMEVIAQIESSNNPEAVGAVGEIGLYQISPIVLKHFNQDHRNATRGIMAYEKSSVVRFGVPIHIKTLSDPYINTYIANWYMNWLFDRTWTVKDTIIAWNWGIGNWRKWKNNRCMNGNLKIVVCKYQDSLLPKVTQDYLKKYEKLTGEKL